MTKKYQIGEILDIESCEGEIYCYGHIKSRKELFLKDKTKYLNQYPTPEDVEVLKEDSTQKFTHYWGRFMPAIKGDEFKYYLLSTEKRTQGTFPFTQVESK